MPAMPHMTSVFGRLDAVCPQPRLKRASAKRVPFMNYWRMRARLAWPCRYGGPSSVDHDLFGALVDMLGIEFSRGNLRRPSNAPLSLRHHRAFHRVHRIDHSVKSSAVHPTIPAGRQRAAGHKMNIGVLATHKQYPFSRVDTRIDL